MRVITEKYEYNSREDSTIKIVPLGDIHVGSKGFVEEEFLKILDWIQENDCYVILMGDYGEFITKNDRRHDYHQADRKMYSPDKQFRYIRDALLPIKDKVLCVLAGNHEYSHWMYQSTDYGNWLALELGKKYCPDVAYIRIKMHRKTGAKATQRRNLNLLATHGYTGARTDAYKVKVIQDMKNIIPSCHGYLMGHVHRLGEALPTTHLWVDNREKIRDFNQYYYFTGSYVKSYDVEKGYVEEEVFTNYAARKGYAPTTIGSPIISAKPNRGESRLAKTTPFSMKYETLEWL